MRVQAANFLGTIFFLFGVAAVVTLLLRMAYLAARGRAVRSARNLLIGWVGTYFAVLLVASALSSPVQLPFGGVKCFDDWCATVDDFEGADSLGAPAAPVRASGRFAVVRVRVISEAKRVELRPSNLRIAIIDADGKEYAPSPAGQQALEVVEGPQPPTDRRVSAGEQFGSALVFDLPAQVREPAVYISEGGGLVTKMIAGDENSLLHRKAVFPLPWSSR